MVGFDEPAVEIFWIPALIAYGGSDMVACFQRFDQGAKPNETSRSGDEYGFLTCLSLFSWGMNRLV